MSYKEPIKDLPNIQDDDTINRGITGQCLRKTGQYYDPATGKPTSSENVNLDLTKDKSEKQG